MRLLSERRKDEQRTDTKTLQRSRAAVDAENGTVQPLPLSVKLDGSGFATDRQR
jgi:hypothetical protein